MHAIRQICWDTAYTVDLTDIVKSCYEVKMKFIGNGYLSADARARTEALLEPHAEILQQIPMLLKEIGTFCASQEIASQESSACKQRVIAIVLCARITEIVEASFLVMKHGMTNETNTLFRAFLDAFFVFGNVCSDEDFVPQYFKSDEAARLKLMNVALRHESELFKRVQEYARHARDELKERIHQENIQAFKSYLYAESIGCEEIYDSMYRLSSSALHTAPRSLAIYVEEDDDGKITEVRNFPQLNDIPQLAYTFCTFLIKVYSGITEVFEQHDPERIKQLEQAVNSSVNKE